MSDLAARSAPAHPPSWPMYRALVGIGVLCAFFIVTAFEVTRPVIQRNRVAALERAIFRVLPQTRAQVAYRLTGQGFEPATITGDGADIVYACYDGQGRLVGFAIPARGMGYQDVIRLLYGYSPAAETIVGIAILESKETPGLGTKIETDPHFLQNFEALDVSLRSDASALANPIEVVRTGEKRQPWQIDGISGATISSEAVGRILHDSTATRLPLIRQHLAQVELRSGHGN